jgi:DNA-binding IclR family transcriptional regulator
MINRNQTTIWRALTIRDLQRQYGANNFSFTDVRNSAGKFGCEAHTVVFALMSSGWIERTGRGKYRLTTEAIKEMTYMRQQFI